MTSLLEIPNYELAAKSLHSTSHEVVDSIPGFICTETTSNTSFTEGNILRVKEIRCDRNNGKIRTTGIIISNKNQVQAGQIVPDSAIYDNVGGFTTAKIVTFDNTVNNSALVVRSGGAYIEDGAIVVGTVTANQFNVSGTSSFGGSMTFNGGLSGNMIFETINLSTRLSTLENNTIGNTNSTYKRNGNTIVTLQNIQTTPSNIEAIVFSSGICLKRNGCPRFMVSVMTSNQSTYVTTTQSETFINFFGVYVNHGNNFNTATRLFTAPIAGDYRFFFNLSLASSQISSVILNIRKNGITSVYEMRATYSSSVSRSPLYYECIMNLAANDWIGIYNNTAGSIQYTNRSSFGGMLISAT